MKKIIMFALLVVASVLTTGCGRTLIEPGHVGVKVYLNGSD